MRRNFLPIFTTLALTVSVLACKPRERKSNEAEHPHAPTEQIDAQEVSGAGDEEKGERFTYRCESGNRIDAWYPTTSSAEILYQNKRIPMTIAISASGARYLGGGYQWWTKGSGPGAPGTLYRFENEGDTSGDILESCEQVES